MVIYLKLSNLYIINLKNNNPYIQQNVKKYITIFFILIVFIILFITKPFTRLKESFNYRITHQKQAKLYPVFNNISKSTHKYISPVEGTVTSNYGYRTNPITGVYSHHTGIDISCYKHRDNVLSVADGIVTFSGSQDGFGYCVEIKHEFENETIYSFYAHLSNITVSTGQTVTQGSVIGNEGGDPYSDPNPGYSTGHHLHFELRNNSGYGNDINPSIAL